MNKKILAILLALLMVVVSGVVMAEENKNIDGSTTINVPITKIFTGNHGAETLSFKVENTGKPNGVENAPGLTASTITVNENVNTEVSGASIAIAPNDFTTVGTYTYTVTEQAGTTAGVTYSSEKYQLKVQVYYATDANGAQTNEKHVSATLRKYDGDVVKVDKETKATFTNEFTANTNGLTVTKKLAGNFADNRDEFTITVKINKTTSDNKPITSTPEVKLNAKLADESVKSEDNDAWTYTFTSIGGNDVITVGNIPTGATYTVSETLTDGSAIGSVSRQKYKSSLENGTTTGTIEEQGASVTVTNTCETTIDTGVTTDTMPYILLMAFVAAAAVIFIMKKRAVNE